MRCYHISCGAIYRPDENAKLPWPVDCINDRGHLAVKYFKTLDDAWKFINSAELVECQF